MVFQNIQHHLSSLHFNISHPAPYLVFHKRRISESNLVSWHKIGATERERKLTKVFQNRKTAKVKSKTLPEIITGKGYLSTERQLYSVLQNI
jgi:hypothetical protein